MIIIVIIIIIIIIMMMMMMMMIIIIIIIIIIVSIIIHKQWNKRNNLFCGRLSKVYQLERNAFSTPGKTQRETWPAVK